MRATAHTTIPARATNQARTVGAASLVMAVALTAGVVTSAQAQPPAMPVTASIIDDQALSQTSGVVLVNEAAGDGNAQNNSGAIAIGPNAVAALQNRQHVEVGGDGQYVATTEIHAQAFDGAHGWIAVNQSAGQGNAQSNGLAIAVGGNVVALTDVQLAQVEVSPAAGAGSVADPDQAKQTTEIADTAFSDVRGVVQVNQSAGRGNVTGNRVRVRISGVAAP